MNLKLVTQSISDALIWSELPLSLSQISTSMHDKEHIYTNCIVLPILEHDINLVPQSATAPMGQSLNFERTVIGLVSI